MKRLALLENPIREYAWGSHTAIAELLGLPSPTPSPQAELWIGAHPSGSSRVLLDGGSVSLLELIERAPVPVLGRRVQERFPGRLPFLLKVLAAERPLSIQAHPDAEQARRGFARDEAAGVAPDSPERLYRDACHKPEILCALSPFHALRGFRPPAEIHAALDALGVAGECTLRGDGDETERLRRFLAGLLGMGEAPRRRLVERVVDAARAGAWRDPACAWIPRLDELHPGDVGVLAPTFLNLVELEPGQAIFLPARELHCYLEGVGVELMANSDNVLRGGLTSKRVAVDELLRTLEFRAARIEVLAPEPGAGGRRYRTPADEFELSRLELADRSVESEAERGVELLLCTEGALEIACREQPAPLPLRRGASCLAPAAAGPYRVNGRGTLYRASVPR